MFGGGSQTQSNQTRRYNAIQLQKSAYGSAIPLVYGTQRIPGSLIYYTDFNAIPNQDQGGGKGGGGGGGNQTYTYQAVAQIALCEGPINTVSNVWADKAVYSFGSLNFTLFSGTGGQSPWSYVTTFHPTEAVPYDRVAHADATLILGSSAGMPNLTFMVTGLTFYPGSFDAEPSAILTDYCTDVHHGCNFQYLGSLTNWQNYCIAMGLLISPAELEQRPAHEFIKMLMEITNSDAWWSPGSLNILPYADAAVSGNSHTYTPNLTPQFDFGDDDYIFQDGENPVNIIRKPPSDVFNVVRVEYLNRARDYNTDIAEAKDDTDIVLRGERVKSTINLHAITDVVVARLVAQLILQRQLYVRSTYQWQVRSDYCLLEPMDLVTITDATQNINRQLVRLTKVDVDETDDVILEGEEVPVGVANAARYNWQLAQGYAANYNAATGSVQTPAIITAPPGLAQRPLELWVAVAPSTGNGNWGGCYVHVSYDNSRFVRIGTIYSPARYGTLTASLASGSDPDNTHTLSVLLNNTNLAIGSGTTADADNNRLLAYVDGEIISYQTATLSGAGAYNITYLRRGKYGSTIAAHALGTAFIRLDGNILPISMDLGLVGQTVYFKFQSFNVYGGALENLASCTVYNHVIAPITITDFVARGNCVVTDDLFYKALNGAVAWDSDIYSIDTFANGCMLSFRPAQAYGSDAFMMGLNSDPTTDQSYTSLDFAWYCAGSGNVNGMLQIYESGAYVGNFGTYTSADLFQIKYDGQVVTYLQNGNVVRQVPKIGQTFFADSSFVSPGAAAKNVSFVPLTAATSTGWVATGAVEISETRIRKYAGASTWGTDYANSSQGYSRGAFISAKWEGGGALSFGLHTGSGTFYLNCVFAWYPHADTGATRLYVNGGDVQDFASPAVGDVYAIAYDGKVARFYRNGSLVREVTGFTDLTLFANVGIFSPGGAFNTIEYRPYGSATPSPFIARGNCVVSDNNFMKVGGANGWDSDIYSMAGYQNCHLSFKINNTVGNAFVGLNTDPTTDQSFASVDYAWHFQGTTGGGSGHWNIYESGSFIVDVGAGSIADVVAIIYDGTTVTYLLNGVGQRAVTNAGKTFFLDSSFYYPNDGVNSVRFGPTTNLAVTDTAQIGANAATDPIQEIFNTARVTQTPVFPGGTVDQDVDTITFVPAADGEVKATYVCDMGVPGTVGSSGFVSSLVWEIRQSGTPFVSVSRAIPFTPTVFTDGTKLPAALTVKAAVSGGVTYQAVARLHQVPSGTKAGYGGTVENRYGRIEVNKR